MFYFLCFIVKEPLPPPLADWRGFCGFLKLDKKLGSEIQWEGDMKLR